MNIFFLRLPVTSQQALRVLNKPFNMLGKLVFASFSKYFLETQLYDKIQSKYRLA